MNGSILEHFLNPRNCGELRGPDGVGIEENNPWLVTILITIRVAEGRIMEAKFKTKGCITAIACASILTELVRGRMMEQAASLSAGDVSEALGKIPDEKIHCCRLAVRALRAAIADYAARNGHLSIVHDVS